MSFPRYPKYKDSGVEWLGDVPEHWQTQRLKHQLRRNDGGVWGDEPVGDGDTIVLRSTEQTVDGRWQIDDPAFRSLNEADIKAALLLEGDLLLTKSSGSSLHIGKTCLVDANVASLKCCYSNFMQRLRMESSFDPKLAWYVLNSDVARLQFDLLSNSTTGLANLNATVIGQIDVPVPPRPEQSAIATFLDRETAKIDALIAEQQRLVGLLDEQLKALALSAFNDTGTSLVRLGAVTEVISRPLVGESGTSYTRLGLYNRGRGIFRKDPSEPEDMGDSDFFWVQEGDLILSGQFAWEGAVAIAGPEESGCVVSHRYPIVRGKVGILRTEFLFGLLCTTHGDFLLNENSRGAAGRNRPLNLGSLLKEKVPVPDIRLQDKAAQIYHRRRSLLKEVEIQQALLQERRSALISAAVTGQIDVRGLAGSEAA